MQSRIGQGRETREEPQLLSGMNEPLQIQERNSVCGKMLIGNAAGESGIFLKRGTVKLKQINGMNPVAADQKKDRLEEGYGVVTLRREDFEALLPEAVLGSRDTGYGVEALVRRDLAPVGLKMERAGIERIMVAMAKEAGK